MKYLTKARAMAPCFARGALILLALLVLPVTGAFAQGVTTGALTGVVTDSQMRPVAGASVLAIHEPSGTTYEGTTRADGRFQIPGMRVGGPYTVTVNFVGTGTAFEPQTVQDVTVNLGAVQDVNFTVKSVAVQETVTVTATVDPVFSSGHTGASTTISRETLGLLPTLGGRINDVIRLTPQAGAGNNMMGMDGRMNNMTIDGSSFNATFGVSSSQPGDRTNTAPISLESLEQVQVNVAPFDVRQGSFTGASVDSVTRSGTNRLSGAFYHRFRNQDWSGSEASGQTVNVGTFTYRNTGGWAGGPIVKNKLFAFGNYEDELSKSPLTTWRSNSGSEATGGQVTRVLASDLTALSAYLKANFNYDTGPFDNVPRETPAKRFLIRSDYNINNSSKVSFRYNYLDSFTDTNLSGSTSALTGRNSNSTAFLTFQNSNYQLMENIRSGIGEWNAVFHNSIANSFQSGYTTQDESRNSRGSMFPFVDIFQGGTSYTSFGYEPFTVNNQLRYQTFQARDNVTKYTTNHSITGGAYVEKFHSDNVFMNCCPQSAFKYNSLADFYTDANAYLANKSRVGSAVPLGAFQLSYSNVAGTDQPNQALDVWYTAAYVQDEWRPRANLTLTGGLRADISTFTNDTYPNADADAMTFRDENGNAVKYSTGSLPDTKVLWSPRLGINWDASGNQKTQVRGGTGLFSGRPAYVWISNQLGSTGVLIGQIIDTAPGTKYGFTTDTNAYKPATIVPGTHSASYTLNVTDPSFKFPQTWRSNIALDQKLPGGIVSTSEYIYSKDVNGVYYINANLPAAQSAFVGVDQRPRWVGTTCVGTGNPTGSCASRINNPIGNALGANYVLKNGNEGDTWNIAETLSKTTRFGLAVRGAYSYGVSHSLSDPESTAATSFARNTQSGDPNNPGSSISLYAPGHRAFALVTYSHDYFKLGATAVSVFIDARQSTVNSFARMSYTFGGDMNGDSVANNDLIYVPKDTSEMNFVDLTTTNGRVFTPAEQASAFEAYIQQDPYLSKHRGQYAERNGAVMPMFTRADLTITQDLFHDISKQRHAFQLRFDFFNFSNLLNHNWGVAYRPIAPLSTNNQLQILNFVGADAQGRPTYRMANANNELITKTFQTSATTSDVYQFLISLRYSFN
jgi:hypothetical protein